MMLFKPAIIGLIYQAVAIVGNQASSLARDKDILVTASYVPLPLTALRAV